MKKFAILFVLAISTSFVTAKSQEIPAIAVQAAKLDHGVALEGEGFPNGVIPLGAHQPVTLLCVEIGDDRYEVVSAKIRLAGAAVAAPTRAVLLSTAYDLTSVILGGDSAYVFQGLRGLLLNRASYKRKMWVDNFSSLTATMWVAHIPGLVSNGTSSAKVVKLRLRDRKTGKVRKVKPNIWFLLPTADTEPISLEKLVGTDE